MLRKITAVMVVVLFLFSIPLNIVGGEGNDLPDPEENSPMAQEPRWSFNTSSDEVYPYLTPGGKLYVFDSDENKLISMDENGLPDWEYDFVDEFTGVSEFSRGYIYLITRNESSDDDSLLKIDPEDGTKIWKKRIEIDGVNNLLVNDDEEIYISSYMGSIVKLSKDMDPVWNKSIDDGGFSRMIKLGDDRNLYVLSRPYYLYCYDQDGEELWSLDIDSGTDKDEYIISISTDTQDIYLFTNRSIYNLDKNGGITWTFEIDRGQISPFSIFDDGTFYLDVTTDDDHFLRTIDDEGKVKWEYNLSRISDDSHIMMSIGNNDRIYYQFINRSSSKTIGVFKILCFDKDGTLAWKQEYEDSDRGFHFISNSGMIYFASEEGIIYAFQGKPAGPEEDGGWITTVAIIITLFFIFILIMIGNSVWKGLSDKFKKEEDQNF